MTRDDKPVTKRCDLCDHSQFELVSDRDRHGRPLATEVCTRCGLVSHQRIPTEEELARFYATEYRQQYHGEFTPSSRRVMRAWRHANRIYQQIAPWLDSGMQVFEVGAGVGCNVKVFEQYGHFSSGIEPNDGFHAYSQEKLRANVAKLYLTDVPAEPAYDLVLLVHVIEHFRSPRTALEHLYQLVHPGGMLYMETPNLGAVATRDRLFHFAHVHNFTPLSLTMMANRCGFEVVQWFVDPRAPNLQVLMRRMDEPRWEIPPDAYQQTLTALAQFNYWTYYFRWEYLSARAPELISRSWEWVVAGAYVREVLKTCAGSIPAARRSADYQNCRS
jgi:2-polyprenyl-3-methyl-5-hydroxy-6-metoxy-1,4-benzoquinol methylase